MMRADRRITLGVRLQQGQSARIADTAQGQYGPLPGGGFLPCIQEVPPESGLCEIAAILVLQYFFVDLILPFGRLVQITCATTADPTQTTQKPQA